MPPKKAKSTTASRAKASPPGSPRRKAVSTAAGAVPSGSAEESSACAMHVYTKTATDVENEIHALCGEGVSHLTTNNDNVRPLDTTTLTRLELPLSSDDITRVDQIVDSSATQSLDADLSGYSLLHLAPIPRFNSSTARKGAKSAMALVGLRQKVLPQRQKLPAYGSKTEISGALKNGRVVVVASHPGAGVTTQVPQIVFDSDVVKKKRVIVVQPCEAIVPVVAARLQKEICDPTLVGYVTQVKTNCTAGTPIVVTTPTVLLQCAGIEGALSGVGVVVVDECQCHTADLDLLLAVLKDAVALGSTSGVTTTFVDCKFVLCSSIHAASTLLAYLKDGVGHSESEKNAVKLVRVQASTEQQPAAGTETASKETNKEGTGIFLLDDVIPWVEQSGVDAGSPPVAVTKGSDLARNHQLLLDELVGDSAGSAEIRTASWHEKHIPFIVSLLRRYDVFAVSGTVQCGLPTLILVPTSYHARSLATAVRSTLGRLVLELHSDMLPCDGLAEAIEGFYASLANDPSSHAGSPVLIGDICAESCATLPAAGLVIDMCRVNVSQYDATTGSMTPSIGFQSSSFVKTRGRFPSHVDMIVRLVSANQFVKLRDHGHFTMRRSDLVSTTLLAKMIYRGETQAEAVLSSRVLDRADGTVLQHANSALLQLGCISRDGQLTPIGILSASFGGVPLVAVRTLVLGCSLDCASASALAAALLIVDTTTLYRSEGMSRADLESVVVRDVRNLEVSCPGDLALGMALASGWQLSTAAASTDAERSDYETTHSLSGSALRAVTQLCHGLIEAMVARGLLPEGSTYAPDDAANKDKVQTIHSVLGASAYPNVALSRPTASTARGTSGEATMAVNSVVLPRKHDPARPHELLPVTIVPHPVGLLSTEVPKTMRLPPLWSYGRCTGVDTTHNNSKTLRLHGVVPLCSVMAVVNSGMGSLQRKQTAPRTAARGWLAPVTEAWRHTPAATRHLPPKPQLQQAPVKTTPYDVVPREAAVLRLDRMLALHAEKSVTETLMKLRQKLRAAMSVAIVRKVPIKLPDDLRGLLGWLVTKERNTAADMRDLRRKTPQSSGPVGGASSPLVATSFAFTYDLTLPIHRLRVVERHDEKAGGPKSTGTGAVGLASKGEFRGLMPSADERALIDRTAQLMASRGSREEEENLRHSSAQFAYLDPMHPLHEYYLHTLHALNPKLAEPGDIVGDLDVFLASIEEEVVREMGEAERRRIEEENEAREREKQESGETAEDAAADGSKTAPQPLPAAAPQQPVAPKQEKKKSAVISVVPVAKTGSILAQPVDAVVGNDVKPGDNAAAKDSAAQDAGGVEKTVLEQETEEAQQLLEEALKSELPPVPYDPLIFSVPPPPIPEGRRVPSVIVSPIPEKRAEGMKMQLVLAKALGETLGIRVGPTIIAGDFARIDVPNQMIEKRALALQSFICLGTTINIRHNDLLFDQPNTSRKIKERLSGVKERLKARNPSHLGRVEFTSNPGDRPGGGDERGMQQRRFPRGGAQRRGEDERLSDVSSDEGRKRKGRK